MIKNCIKKSIILLTLACTIVSVSGCSKTSADWPPSEFYAELNGKDEIVGSDISIAKEIAKDIRNTAHIS